MMCTCSDPPNSQKRYEDHGGQCDIHVQCDEDCQALQMPFGVTELRAALVHWQDHEWVGGCSHGC
jgi:hypothetical protein